MKKLYLKFNEHMRNLVEFNKENNANYLLYNILLSHDILFELNMNNTVPTDPYMVRLYSSVVKSAVMEEEAEDNINMSSLGIELYSYMLSNSMKNEDKSIEDKSAEIIEFIKKYQNEILKYSSDDSIINIQIAFSELLSRIILKLNIDSFIEFLPLYKDFKLLSEVFLFRPDFVHNENVKLYLMANNCEYETNAYKIYSLLAENKTIVQRNNCEPRLSPDFMMSNKNLICNEMNMTDGDIKKYPLAIDLRKCVHLSLTHDFYKDFLHKFFNMQAYKDTQFEMMVLFNNMFLDDGDLVYESIPSIAEILAMDAFDMTLFEHAINMLIEIIVDQSQYNIDYILVKKSVLILLNIIYNILFDDNIANFRQYISDRDNECYPFEARLYSNISDSINSSDFKCEDITRTKINFILNTFKNTSTVVESDANKNIRDISKVLLHASLNIFELDSVEKYFCKSYIRDNHQYYYDTGIRKERKLND